MTATGRNSSENKSSNISRDRLITISDRLRVANLHKRELNFKLVVIGDFGVGKTSIINRYTDGTCMKIDELDIPGIFPTNRYNSRQTHSSATESGTGLSLIFSQDGTKKYWQGSVNVIRGVMIREFSSSYKVTIGADFAVKTLEWDEETRINLHLWDIAGHERFGALTGIFYRHSVGAALVFDLTRPETFKSIKKWLTDLRKKVSLPGGQAIPTILLANKGDITIKTLPKEINDFCLDNNIMAWFITSAKNNIQIDEAMLRLTNAALKNHHSLQFPLITDDVIKISSENGEGPPNGSIQNNDNRRYYCCTS